MPSTPVQDSWVLDVLGFDLRAAPGGTVQEDDEVEPSQGWLTDKLKGLVGKRGDKDTTTPQVDPPSTEVSASTLPPPDPSSPGKSRILGRLARLPNPGGATPDQVNALDAERDAVRAALTDDAPTAEKLAEADRALDKLAGLIASSRRAKVIADLETADPATATKAKAAFTGYATVIGTRSVTPDSIKQAGADKAARKADVSSAEKAVKDAKALPAGPAATTALQTAQHALTTAKAELAKADALEDAMIGQSSLTDALSTGPLSAGSRGPLKDPAIAGKLIDAYAKSGRMADKAVSAAATAKYPGLVADNVGPMIDRAKANFADATSRHFTNSSYSEEYGSNLLKASGELGPDYVGRMSDYLASGQQFVNDGAGDGVATKFKEVAQNRSRTLARAMVKPDGGIDTDSPAAKAAIGNLLFHPDAVTYGTPGLSENVLQTLKMLKDPATRTGAETTLKGVTAPNNPAAQTLLRGSLRKPATEPLDDAGARTAVLSAMLQPLNQGSVGSCFVTGPARALRETRPLDVMKSYAELATSGTYTPAGGTAIPAVTNIDPTEDPLMRSFEYTAATAGARLADSRERKKLAGDVALGTDLLKDAAMKGASGDKKKGWEAKQQKLAADVAAAFVFDYDATAAVTGSADGSSSQGRYVIRYGTTAVRTKAEFQTAMLAIALASLGIAAGSKAAEAVAAVVNSDAFATKVCPRKDQAPWALVGGGFAEGSLESLNGTKVSRHDLAAEAGKPPPPEGERTRQVLSGLLNGFRGSTSSMAAIDTRGQHSFNALPTHPSLAALKGANDTETAQKVQANLIDKGLALRDTEITAERAGALFDAAVLAQTGTPSDAALQKLVDDGVARNRPTAAMKPAAVARAVQAAVEAFNDKVAETRTGTWKTEQTTKGKPPTAQEEAAHKAKLKEAFDAGAGGHAKSAMIRDMGAPEFVIADTNWGSESSHTYFVVAPDPTTGEPLLWNKTEPPGSMKPAGRDWIDRSWQVFQ